jgi:hypothetical protein
VLATKILADPDVKFQLEDDENVEEGIVKREISSAVVTQELHPDAVGAGRVHEKKDMITMGFVADKYCPYTKSLAPNGVCFAGDDWYNPFHVR